MNIIESFSADNILNPAEAADSKDSSINAALANACYHIYLVIGLVYYCQNQVGVILMLSVTEFLLVLIIVLLLLFMYSM